MEKLVDLDEPVRFRDRNEQEFAGYRDAVENIIRTEPPERMSVPLIVSIHRDLFRHTQARGGCLKTDDNRIVERDENGMRVVLFDPPPWQQTEFLLTELVTRYTDALDQQVAHPILLLGAFILDFLGRSIRSPTATDGWRGSSPRSPSWNVATACPDT